MDEGVDDKPVEGRFAGREHRLGVRVYFEDTDLSGVVYHANYLRWMERGRSDMLRLAGIDQRAAHQAGEGAYAVSDVSIRYKAPARLDDSLVVATRLVAIRPASCRIHQRVIKDGLILAEAEVTAVFVSPGGRARRQPAAWIAAFEQLVWPDVEQGKPTADAQKGQDRRGMSAS
ncbi:YbgC/FadM family acyl-CoA thioesterase [Sphingomonas sp. 28-63-12]|uniref:YbgC/FadM family acyl-CoA thioesterase n=1 Tax=Sphingomonas sp. 28-63-12 TaxID=1970434 RepID=UPI000BC3EC8F|nr:MAG: thioesterase [Sphingomonas sp. 28-63-12]